jgi:polyhydroxybutyrate depolymerase
VISTPDTHVFWRRADGCAAAPEVRALPDRDPGDGVTVTLERSAACADGAEVLLYTARGGGHRWPGRADQGGWLLRRLLGATPMDLDATAEIWAFFERHRR